jgi:hypothetical protein
VCRRRVARHAMLPWRRGLFHHVLPPARDNPSALDRLSRPTSRASWRSLGRQRVRFPALRKIGRRSGAALRKGSAPARRPTPDRGAVSFLLCTADDISTLRRQSRLRMSENARKNFNGVIEITSERGIAASPTASPMALWTSASSTGL